MYKCIFDVESVNKINFVVDGALYSHVVSLFTANNLTPMVSICSPHNTGRLGKRTVQDNLATHWDDGPAYIEVMFDFKDRSSIK